MSQKNAFVRVKSSRMSELMCWAAAFLLLLLVIQIIVFKSNGMFSGALYSANLVLIPAILGIVFCKDCIFDLDTFVAQSTSVAAYFVSPSSLLELVSQTPAPEHRPPVAFAL